MHGATPRWGTCKNLFPPPITPESMDCPVCTDNGISVIHVEEKDRKEDRALYPPTSSQELCFLRVSGGAINDGPKVGRGGAKETGDVDRVVEHDRKELN